MLFAQRTNGDVVLIDPWPERADFAAEFLETGAFPWVQVGDGIVTLRVLNATASYGLGKLDLQPLLYHGVLGPGATWEDPDACEEHHG